MPLVGYRSDAEDAVQETCLAAIRHIGSVRDPEWGALQRLPEPLRVSAMLRYFGSYDSYDEVATILGVPIGTVRSRLSEAKIKLAEALLASAALIDDVRVRARVRTSGSRSSAWSSWSKESSIHEVGSTGLADSMRRPKRATVTARCTSGQRWFHPRHARNWRRSTRACCRTTWYWVGCAEFLERAS